MDRVFLYLRVQSDVRDRESGVVFNVVRPVSYLPGAGYFWKYRVPMKELPQLLLSRTDVPKTGSGMVLLGRHRAGARPSSRALVGDLIDAVGGDVSVLMSRVEAREGEAFKRKQRDLAEVLAQILEEDGALDTRPVLEPGERLGRLADLHGDRLDLDTIAWLDRLWSQRILSRDLVETDDQVLD